MDKVTTTGRLYDDEFITNDSKQVPTTELQEKMMMKYSDEAKRSMQMLVFAMLFSLAFYAVILGIFLIPYLTS